MSLRHSNMSTALRAFLFGLVCLGTVCFWLIGIGLLVTADEPDNAQTLTGNYSAIVQADHPVAFWHFSVSDFDGDVTAESPDLVNRKNAANRRVIHRTSGPTAPHFPFFEESNSALRFPAAGGYLKISDSGDKSRYDFDLGDSLTLEAWVNPRSVNGAAFHHIIQKGRTGRPGFDANNQNYALRLKSPTGQLSFLFRSRGENSQWHRWTSKAAVAVGDGWHHVAVSYTFGEKDSLLAYIDGIATAGTWDMGGATDRAPVIDNDEIWIGNSFDGVLDEVAIYRTALSAKRIADRYRYIPEDVDKSLIPRIKPGSVLVDITEGLPDAKSWNFRHHAPDESYFVDSFGFIEVPHKYTANSLRGDRALPYLFRATAKVVIPEGRHRILIRAHNAARLYIDGKQVLQTPFFNISASAHGEVVELDRRFAPHIRPLRRGDLQAQFEFDGDDRAHVIRYEMIVGGGGRRGELGEACVAIGHPGEDLQILSPSGSVTLLTDEEWPTFADEQQQAIQAKNTENRRVVDSTERAYWQERHAIARQMIQSLPAIDVPTVSTKIPVNNAIDRFIGAGLEAAKKEPAALTDDAAFQRRVSLDLLGIVPSIDQIREFRQDQSPSRRARLINRLLDDPRWADHWVGYWQDVLAENPNIIKPSLNNSGPFRWWIYESFLDNKPIDRFVTELVMMQGSRNLGGPAGFEFAAENDVPMAAKARVLMQAFLGVNLKCARCHDDPHRDYLQRDLFQVAAMLKRSDQEVPATSSIPSDRHAAESLIVKVTLKPGEKVVPKWPFESLCDRSLPPGLLRNKVDSRELLATLMTSPTNSRFAQTIVNRMWRFYLGRGLVDPVDNWDGEVPSHPELLEFLARELILHQYDLKHIARLIINSHTYQRVPATASEDLGDGSYRFAAPVKRKMRAEQLVDSLFSISGKSFDSGPITLDPDGALPIKTALNLGEPTRAWEFSSLSNERDRPSLAMPFAQPFVTVLEAFGWRSSRQDSITVRHDNPTVIQPAIMANGLITQRIVRLSDDSAFTSMALRIQPLDQLIDQVFLQVLSRDASADERLWFAKLLSPGYQDRIVDASPATKPDLPRGLVSWSNHLSVRANEIKLELQEAVRRGDPPTARLQTEWRERLEDMLWVLINAPEFIFLP